MSVTFPCSAKRSPDGSKCKNIGTDVILAHEQLVVPKPNLWKKMTSHNKRKSRNNLRKINLHFHVYLKITVWIFHSNLCLPKTSIFLTETMKVSATENASVCVKNRSCRDWHVRADADACMDGWQWFLHYRDFWRWRRRRRTRMTQMQYVHMDGRP